MTKEEHSDDQEYAPKLSVEHRKYLLGKHGRFDLDPLPSVNDEDPLNWPLLLKSAQLAMVAFHAFTCTFMAAGLIPSFALLAAEFDITITQCSYLTSAQIIVLGVFPFVWMPVMNRYGRLQLLLLSTLGSMVCNIGCMYAKSYASLMTCRVLGAFMISPAVAVGGPVVAEVSFSYQRGSRTGWWAVMITIGTHFGPFLMGFVEKQTGETKNVFLIFAVMNAVQFLAYLIIGRETVYDQSVWYPGINKLWKITKKRTMQPLSWYVFLSPLECFLLPKVLLATIAYSVCFAYSNVALGVELTGLYHEKYGFDPQQIGLQFVGLILGALFGEQLGGWMSDLWMSRKINRDTNMITKCSGEPPEYRLWLSYIGFAGCVVGTVVYGVFLERNSEWTIVPVVGLAIASFGLQIITTVLITYCIDTIPAKASDVSLFITLLRQVYGFIGPFYFPVMLENPNLGIKGTYSLLAGLMVVFGFVPTLILHIFQRKAPKS
ncbi:hypothetical protein CAAN3_07S05358 [[Candida] anglica]